MRLAVKGRLTEKHLAEIMRLLKMQPPGFSFEFDGFITFGGDPHVAAEAPEVGALVSAQASSNEHDVLPPGQPSVAMPKAPVTEDELETEAEASRDEKFERFKPQFFRDYDTQAEFDAAALRGEYPDFPAAITVRERTAELAESVATRAVLERRQQVFARILKDKGEFFIAALNAAIGDVWCEAKPVYPHNGNGGTKGAPRPMPSIERRGGQLLIHSNSAKQTFHRIKTPFSLGNVYGRPVHIWLYAEWVDMVVPRLAQVVDEFERSTGAAASTAA